MIDRLAFRLTARFGSKASGVLVAAALLIGFAAQGPAAAQDIGINNQVAPARNQALASGRIDLRSGEFQLRTVDLSVGSGSFPSRIDLVRTHSSVRGMDFNLDGRATCIGCSPYVYNDGSFPGNFKASRWPGVSIVLFGTTYAFIQNANGGYDGQGGDGATLVRSADDKRLEFTGRDGLKAFFEFTQDFTCGYNTAAEARTLTWSKSICQRVRHVEFPNGMSLAYKYVSRTGPDYSDFPLAYMSEVVNSRGYGIRFTYGSGNQTLVTAATAFRSSCVSGAAVDCNAGVLGSVSYGYDSYSVRVFGSRVYRLQYFTDSEGARTEYEYDPGSIRMIAARSPQTPSVRSFTNTYTNGRVTAQADAQANQTTYTYGAAETLITDPLNHVTRYGFSGDNPLPIYTEDANGNRTSFTYDSYFRLTRTQAPEGNAVETVYDARGNVTETRHKAKPGSGLADLVSSANYPAGCGLITIRICNNPTYTIDARGQRTDYIQSPLHGGIQAIVAPPDAQGYRAFTRLNYTTRSPAAGSAPPAVAGAPAITQRDVTVLTSVDRCRSPVVNANATSFCPAADTIRTEMIYAASASGAPTSFELEQVALDSTGQNLRTSYTYDQVGNLIREDGSRAGADVTQTAFDRRRSAVSVTGPTVTSGPPRYRYSYDANGRLEKVESGLGSGWMGETYAYDTRGLQSVMTSADGVTSTRTFDVAGRAVESAYSVDGVTRRSRTILDPGGRMMATLLAAGTPLQQASATMSYTPNGQVASQTDAAGNISQFCYDGFDRLVERRYPSPESGVAPACSAIAPGATLPAGVTRDRVVYAANGDLTSSIGRGGQAIGVSYDNLGRVIAKDLPGTERDVTYVFDLLGQRTQANLTANPALSVQWTYDTLGRVTGSTGAFGRSVGYAYDADGGAMELQLPEGTRVRYVNDALGRVKQITDGGSAVLAALTYDEMSRRVGVSRGNGTASTYIYNNKAQLSGLVHDLGGASHDVAYGFTYNEAGEIRSRSVSNAAFGMVNPGDVQRTYRPRGGAAAGGDGLNRYGLIEPNPNTLAYDLAGNLIQDADPQRLLLFGYDVEGRLTTADGATLTYDAVGRLAEVRKNGAGSRFLYDGDFLIGEYDLATGGLVRRYVHGPGMDEPMVQYDGTVPTWLYPDERGSIVAMARGDGQPTALNTYGVYGEPGQLLSGRFGYTGQVWLPEVGLYHYKSRAYSPWLGRFLQPDPIGEGGGMNLYAYVNNDPINYTDPTGAYAIVDDVIFFVGGGIVGAAISVGTDYLLTGKSSWGSAAGGFVSGAIGGMGMLYIPATAGGSAIALGAAGGGAGSIVKQAIENQGQINWVEVTKSSAFGAASGGFGGPATQAGFRIAMRPISAGRNSWYAVGQTFITKFRNSTIENVSARTAWKGMAGFQVYNAPVGVSAAGAEGVVDKAVDYVFSAQANVDYDQARRVASDLANQAASRYINDVLARMRYSGPSVITSRFLGFGY